MTKDYLYEIIEKVEKRGEKNFSEFLKFIYDVYKNDILVKLNHYCYEDGNSVEKIGKIVDFDILFNERFPDFDFNIRVNDQKYAYAVRNITAKDIYFENGYEYILRSKEYEMRIIAK